jgi:hypothetical protein
MPFLAFVVALVAGESDGSERGLPWWGSHQPVYSARARLSPS